MQWLDKIFDSAYTPIGYFWLATLTKCNSITRGLLSLTDDLTICFEEANRANRRLEFIALGM